MTTFEGSIADFLALGRRLQANPLLTGQLVLEELTTWYRDARVEGADIAKDADMLLLQWGATRPLIVSTPTDLRKRGGRDVTSSTSRVRYLDFTRQVFDASAGEDGEFDDFAVQMSITLGFGSADGSEASANQWIESPDNIEKGIQKFVRVPFVRSFLTVPAISVHITVDHCG